MFDVVYVRWFWFSVLTLLFKNYTQFNIRSNDKKTKTKWTVRIQCLTISECTFMITFNDEIVNISKTKTFSLTKLSLNIEVIKLNFVSVIIKSKRIIVNVETTMLMSLLIDKVTLTQNNDEDVYIQNIIATIKNKTKEKETLLKIAEDCWVVTLRIKNDNDRDVIVQVYFKIDFENEDVKFDNRTLDIKCSIEDSNFLQWKSRKHILLSTHFRRTNLRKNSICMKKCRNTMLQLSILLQTSSFQMLISINSRKKKSST